MSLCSSDDNASGTALTDAGSGVWQVLENGYRRAIGQAVQLLPIVPVVVNSAMYGH